MNVRAVPAPKFVAWFVVFGSWVLAVAGCGGEAGTRPSISEDVSPLQAIAPIADHGHVTQAYLRKPPGDGPFPAVVLIHGGLRQLPPGALRDAALGIYPSRFLESGYVVVFTTYRSRDQLQPRAALHLQTAQSLADVKAAVQYTRELAYVDRTSVVVDGCSGGGDLALRLAAQVDLPAVVAEEPAPVVINLVTEDFAARFYRGEDIDMVAVYRSAGGDDEFLETTSRITSPILLVHGNDESSTNRFNAEIRIPELEAAGKEIRVAGYSGGHCFAFGGGTSASSLRAFQDTDAYIRERLRTQPKPVDPSLVQRVPANQPPERTAIAVADKILEGYAGKYALPAGLAGLPPGVEPTLVVTLEDGRLMVEVEGGTLGKVAFLPASETLFFGSQGWTMEFVTDEAGTVTELFWLGGLWAPRQ
jgi:dienelactone hydrolase